MKQGSFLKRMDSIEMEARFSNADAIKYDELKDYSITYDEIRPFLYRLPPREIDLIELYYNERKNQKDIAKIFGVTQGAISSRLTRAKKRLKFLRNLPKITDEEIDTQLGVFFDPLNLEIIKYMMKTTCQSKTAQLINEKFSFTEGRKMMTQVKVRHRFEKCLTRIGVEMKEKTELKKFHKLLSIIKDNLYLLHEVKLPHFDRGEFAVFSMTV